MSRVDVIRALIQRGFPESTSRRIASGELPMDETSRMARAREQGFLPETVYHGTASDIQAFDPAQFGGDVTRARSARMGTWFANDPEVAATYARFAAEDVPVRRILDQADEAARRGNFDLHERLILQAEQLALGRELVDGGGQSIIPARLRADRWHGGREGLLNVDAGGATVGELDDGQIFQWAQDAQRRGRDGLRIRNFSDNADYGQYMPRDHYLVFDPANIRSINAAFDPEQVGSRNLLAGIGGGAVGLGLLAAPNEAAATTLPEADPMPESQRPELRNWNPTARDRAQQAIAGLLQRLGMSSYEANRQGRAFAGSRGPDGGIGLLDLTPAGLVFGAQEGSQAYQMGRNIGGAEGAVESGLGLLEVGLSALPARPMTRSAMNALRGRPSRRPGMGDAASLSAPVIFGE